MPVMPDDRGAFADAARARETRLAQRLAVSASADRGLAAVLADAHRHRQYAQRLLDTIETEIRQAARGWPGLDTPAGARQFQQFLTAKTRQIQRVILDAAADGRDRAALVRSLGRRYRIGGEHSAEPLGGRWRTGPGQPPRGGVSAEQLMRIMPNLSRRDAERYLPFLNRAMLNAGITTPRRQAAFLAQVAVESGQLRYWEELGDERYFRSFLGNDWAYHGRGPIQLTHSSTYLRAGQALGVGDALLRNPALVAQPEMGFRTSAWFWSGGNPNAIDLNTLADRASPGNLDAFRRITVYVRGDAGAGSHYAERVQFYQRACRALGAS